MEEAFNQSDPLEIETKPELGGEIFVSSQFLDQQLINNEVCIQIATKQEICADSFEFKNSSGIKEPVSQELSLNIKNTVPDETELKPLVQDDQIFVLTKSPSKKIMKGKYKNLTEAEMMRRYRANRSAEQKERARERNRVQAAARRAVMSDAKRQEIREKDRIRTMMRRATLSEEERQWFREKNQSYKAAQRAAAQTMNCVICDMRFYSVRKLAKHMKEHKCDEPYICSVCDKKFPMDVLLIDHMKRHIRVNTHYSKEKPVLCSQCGKSFSKKYIKVHEQSHSCEEPS